MEVRVSPALTREERRSLALHAAIAAHLCADPASTLTLARANLARMREQHPAAGTLLGEWNVLLDHPLEALLAVLADPGQRACELRHVTPFGGVLSARERATLYSEFAGGERRHES